MISSELKAKSQMLPAGGRWEASRAQAFAFSQYLMPTAVLTCVGPSHGGQPSPRHQLRRRRVGGIQIPKSALEIPTGMVLHAQIPNSNYRGKQPPNLDFSLDGIVHDDAAAGAPLYPSRDRPNCFPILRA
jgi:hypothetical protein